MAKKPQKRQEQATDTTRTGLDLGSLREFIGFNLRRAQLELRRQYLQNIGYGDIQPGQASLLYLIARNPGESQIELATTLGMDKATVVDLFDRLEEAGCIIRRKSEADRRRHALYVTEKGERMAEKLHQQVRALEDKLRAKFTDDELKDFLDFLQRLYLT